MENKETCKWKHDCVNYYYVECLLYDKDSCSKKYDCDKFCSFCGKEIEDINDES